MSKTNRVLLVVNLLIGAFLLGSTSSQSVSATESGAVISACVAKSNGALRISSKCTKLETPITWNQTGVAGPIGPIGPKGDSVYPNTKLVTIRYIGGSGLFACGDGFETFSSVRMYNHWSTDTSNLTKSWNWSSNPICSITIRVVQ